MTPERWQRIKEVYESAAERSPEDREGYLAEECAADAGLRQEVHRMLRYGSGEGPLDRPAWDGAALDTGLPAGAQLGPYQILEEIGAGGMGRVYKARDTRLNRLVAIKVVDDASSARFLREAHAVAALNHPHICALHDVGPNYLVMELLDGRTLAARLREGPLRFEQVLEYGAQIADAVQAAHAHGIIHRDLKPANIMLTDSGAKVLDFGLAKQDATESTRTAEGTVAGTLAYMSPEQAEGRPVDARSDIFSFGSVLYEMATGRAAFQGESNLSTVAAILRAEPSTRGVAPELAKVIHGCLHKEPFRRFQRMDDVQSALAQMQQEASQPRAPRVRRLWAGIAALALAAVALAWWMGERTAPANFQAVPLTGLPGVATQPSLSPDGDRVAFAWNGDKQDNTDIYVKQIGANAQLRLTTDPRPEADPAWSPDDRYIAFTRPQPDGTMAVMLIPPLGGPERKVADVISPSSGGNRRLCWTPDGRWLAVSAQNTPKEPFAIWLYSVESGERRRLTATPDPTTSDANPSISPNGKFLAFSRGGKANYWVRLYVQRLSPDWRPLEAPQRLTAELHPLAYGIAWTADSQAIVYGAGSGGTPGLWRTSLSRRLPARLNFGAPPAYFPAISGGRFPRLIYGWSTLNKNVWRLDTRSGERKPWIVSRGIQGFPRYSPDGRRIAFESTRSGNTQVWTCEADGTLCMQLTFGERTTGGPRWSPDGEWLAMGSTIGGDHQVYVMRADGSALRPFTSGASENGSPSWSHDGRWIYFESDRSGRKEIWKMPAGGGNASQVTFAGGIYPYETADGKYVYYTKDGNPGPLFRLPVEGGEEEQALPAVATKDNWALTGQGVYFIVPGKPATVRFQDFATGKVRVICELDQVSVGMSVSPDGAYILVTHIDHLGQDLMLVENFR